MLTTLLEGKEIEDGLAATLFDECLKSLHIVLDVRRHDF